MDNAIKRLEALGEKGLIVSIAYGPYTDTMHGSDVEGAEKGDLLYSLDVQWPDGTMFRKPYASRTFEEVVTIAEVQTAQWETEKR